MFGVFSGHGAVSPDQHSCVGGGLGRRPARALWARSETGPSAVGSVGDRPERCGLGRRPARALWARSEIGPSAVGSVGDRPERCGLGGRSARALWARWEIGPSAVGSVGDRPERCGLGGRPARALWAERTGVVGGPDAERPSRRTVFLATHPQHNLLQSSETRHTLHLFVDATIDQLPRSFSEHSSERPQIRRCGTHLRPRLPGRRRRRRCDGRRWRRCCRCCRTADRPARSGDSWPAAPAPWPGEWRWCPRP
jgi:hypothetical protein